MRISISVITIFFALACIAQPGAQSITSQEKKILPGAERVNVYLPFSIDQRKKGRHICQPDLDGG
jgi:hypothetical protein